MRKSNVLTGELSLLGEGGTKHQCVCMWLYKHGKNRDTVEFAWLVGMVGMVGMVGIVGMARQRLISSSKK